MDYEVARTAFLECEIVAAAAGDGAGSDGPLSVSRNATESGGTNQERPPGTNAYCIHHDFPAVDRGDPPGGCTPYVYLAPCSVGVNLHVSAGAPRGGRIAPTRNRRSPW